MSLNYQILSISYNETLLQTRHLMLRERGHQVTSACGFAESFQQCAKGEWHLLIMGHSIPLTDKRALMNEFRRNNTSPVLALHRMGDPDLDGADHSLNPEHPEELLRTVDQILTVGSDLTQASAEGFTDR